MGNCDKNSCSVSTFNWCGVQQWIRTASLATVAVCAVLFMQGHNSRPIIRERMMGRMQNDEMQMQNETAPRRGMNRMQNDAVPHRGN